MNKMEGINEAISHTLAEMMVSFTKRMDSFDETLRKKTTSPASVEGLAEEFAAFKTFIVGSLRSLQLQVACIARETDQLEMRSRRKILLLHGIPEQPKDDTAAAVVRTVVDTLRQTSFTTRDISRCHRMGRQSDGKPRPILFKLCDVAVRGKIWSAKSALKGSGITLSEFLTKARHDVFMAARQRFGMSKCWTMEGSVYVIGADGSRRRVRCMEDLSAIAEHKEVDLPSPPVPVPVAKVTAGTSKPRRAAAVRK